jgi:hypothetical protein
VGSFTGWATASNRTRPMPLPGWITSTNSSADSRSAWMRVTPVAPAWSFMLPDWSSTSMAATAGRAMLLADRVKTKSWFVSSQ